MQLVARLLIRWSCTGTYVVPGSWATLSCPALQADGREVSGRELAVVPRKTSAQGDAGSDGDDGGAPAAAPAQMLSHWSMKHVSEQMHHGPANSIVAA